jgi:hypothetical protein
MQSNKPLSGLDRFLEVLEGLRGRLQEQEQAVQVEPPQPPAPAGGVHVAGLPLDPLLAAIYARLGCVGIEEGFLLIRLREPHTFNFFTVNAEWRRDKPEPFASLLVFGKDDMLASYYATIPSLADAAGLQPVVKVDVHAAPYALPLASSADRFFEAYSRYLEALVLAPDFDEEGSAALSFPWDVPAILARDRPLVQMLAAGRFGPWMGEEASTSEWIARILEAAR